MAIDTIIKVAGTVPAGVATSDIAAIDIPEDGEIICIGGLILGHNEQTVNTAIENDIFHVSSELSFLSTHQIGANDARGTIAGIGVSSYILFGETGETGGGCAKMSEIASICFDEGISVNAGERIHMHGNSNVANLTADVTFLIYLKTKGGGRRAGRRR